MVFAWVLGASILSAVGAALTLGAARIWYHRRWLRLQLPLMQQAFEVLDPLFNERLVGLNGREVRVALALAVEVLGEGRLPRKEVRALAVELERRWRPSRAAGKKRSDLPIGSTGRRLFDALHAVLGGSSASAADLPSLATAVRLRFAIND